MSLTAMNENIPYIERLVDLNALLDKKAHFLEMGEGGQKEGVKKVSASALWRLQVSAFVFLEIQKACI
jgi:hypothetical protein